MTEQNELKLFIDWLEGLSLVDLPGWCITLPFGSTKSALFFIPEDLCLGMFPEAVINNLLNTKGSLKELHKIFIVSKSSFLHNSS